MAITKTIFCYDTPGTADAPKFFVLPADYTALAGTYINQGVNVPNETSLITAIQLYQSSVSPFFSYTFPTSVVQNAAPGTLAVIIVGFLHK